MYIIIDFVAQALEEPKDFLCLVSDESVINRFCSRGIIQGRLKARADDFNELVVAFVFLVRYTGFCSSVLSARTLHMRA